MTPFCAELIGTMILIILGDGVVANVVLNKTKGNNGGWIVITAGWAFAVAIAVYCVGTYSGGHFNPAVTIAMAAIGHNHFPWADVPMYICAQMIGAFIGAVIVWITYLPHWRETSDQGAKLAVFCTGPAIRNQIGNLACEIVGTFILVLGVLAIGSDRNLSPDSGWDKGFGPALVGMLVWAIGLSLGGATGYAINPARDLAPRIAHALLPIPGKGGSDWAYAPIPILGPIVGGMLGAGLYTAFWH